MSLTLTQALAALAVVLVLALLLHGWWSGRRAAPLRAQGDTEPALAEGTTAPPDHDRPEPAMGGEADAGTAGVERPASFRAGVRRHGNTRIDALIDAIVPLALDAPVTGDAALAHAPASRRAGGKPFQIEGLDVDGDEWEPLAAGRRYRELQVGVQLANRSGALNEIEYSEFVQKVEAYAEAVGARADMPDMLEVVARARELDTLTAPLDAQLSVTLRANGVAWSVAYVQQVAGRLGFVPGAVPGRMVLPGPEDGAPPLLALSFDPQAALADTPQDAALREVVLALDVPQSPESAEPFPAWHRQATALAADLDATATDDHGQPLTLHGFAAIGNDLNQLYRRLEELDLAAGSPAARRLFT